jgi:antirestriction protein ArdC
MKRDLYSEVSARIVAELEAGAAPSVKPWSATPGANTPCNAVSNRPYSGCNVILLWMAQAAGYRTPRFLTFKQALELGGNVRKGEHGRKVYFVKQLQVQDKGEDDNSSTRLVPMRREYTVFNVDQCENLPDSVKTGKPMRVRNPDARDDLADAFLHELAPTSARATAKPAISRAATLSRCRIRWVQGSGSLLQRGVP